MRLGNRHYKYDGVLDIPEGTIGKFSIKHIVYPAGHKLYTAGQRTSVIAGHKRKEVVFDRPVRWHSLLEGGGVWMTDLPIEQAQHDEELLGMRGHVLVGGLGLGYAATVLARSSAVLSVTVVEKSSEVIWLAWGATLKNLKAPLRKKVCVVNKDLFTFLRQRRRAYGLGTGVAYCTAFYDIWASDGEATFFNTVLPLRKLSEGCVVEDTVNWNEDVMRGQLRFGLVGNIYGLTLGTDTTLKGLCTLLPKKIPGHVFYNWKVPFFQWMRRRKPTTEQAMEASSVYAAIYGKRGWAESWARYTR